MHSPDRVFFRQRHSAKVIFHFSPGEDLARARLLQTCGRLISPGELSLYTLYAVEERPDILIVRVTACAANTRVCGGSQLHI